jgi:peptidoglycan-N-acetylmuramic acid deacetylase
MHGYQCCGISFHNNVTSVILMHISFLTRFLSRRRGRILSAAGLAVLLIAAYAAGSGVHAFQNARQEADSASVIRFVDGNWGLSFQQEGSAPVGNASAAELKQYQAAFVDETDEKVIYLTFDAGYENGNLATILDALKKHNAPATFFLVGNFLETSPDLAKRIVAEGHTAGNHTYHHPDMSQISSLEDFQKELDDNNALFEQITGQPMSRYYRPPQGKYSTANLQMAKDLGYTTFFWSLAYVDWIQDDQPTKEEAFSKLLTRIHPGAVVLLHSTSSTNAEILDELLTKWEEMGYHFAPLSDLEQKLIET